MEFLGWIDNRTLLASECIVIVIFAAMMFGLRALYSGLRGITSVAMGFLCGAPAALLFASVGKIPLFTAGVIGGGLTFVSSIFLYRGILQFCHAQHARLATAGGLRSIEPSGNRTPRSGLFWLYGVCGSALVTLLFITLWHPGIASCVATITFTLALGRGLKAWALYRCAGGRKLMELFAISMAIFGLVSASNAVMAMTAFGAKQFLQRGSPQTLTLLLSMIFFCVQGVFYLLMFAGDVTETVHEQASLDHLSGTLNRRGIEDALLGEIERRRRAGGSFSVLLIDIDHFKSINDRFGHAAGDSSLKTVARCIHKSVRAYDQLGRFGGDEFLLLLPQTTGEEALWTAERIRDEVRGRASEAAATFMSVSIGVTCCSGQEDMAQVLSRADAALYQAKREGRNRVHIRNSDSTNLGSMVASTVDFPGFAEVVLPGEAQTV